MVRSGDQRQNVFSTVEEMMHTNAAHASAGFIVALERNYSPVSWLRHSCRSFSAESSPSSGGMAPASDMYKYEVRGGKQINTPFLEQICTHLLGGE